VNQGSFGAYIKSLRKLKGQSLVQLSDNSGISFPHISRIENGKRGVPKPDTLKSLSEALEVPYEEMMRVAGYLK